MKMIIILSLLLSQIALARTVITRSFTIFPYSGGNISYYSCDFAEYKTQEVINALGGEVLNIHCTGGIDPFGNFSQPNFVKVKFELPEITENATKTIVLKDRENCHVVTEILQNLKRSFPIESIRGAGHCFRPNSSYKIRIDIKH